MDLHLYPLRHNFKIGDKVIDVTAEANGWPDKEGQVVEVDGSNVKVKYSSGNERWKMHVRLKPAP